MFPGPARQRQRLLGTSRFSFSNEEAFFAASFAHSAAHSAAHTAPTGKAPLAPPQKSLHKPGANSGLFPPSISMHTTVVHVPSGTTAHPLSLPLPQKPCAQTFGLVPKLSNTMAKTSSTGGARDVTLPIGTSSGYRPWKSRSTLPTASPSPFESWDYWVSSAHHGVPFS